MNIVIIGASGQSQAVLEALAYNKNINIVGYLDNNTKLHNQYISGIKVLGEVNLLEDIKDVYSIEGFIVAIGDNDTRRKYIEEIMKLGLTLVNAIHPKSIISERAELGKGIFVGAGAVIGPYCKINDGCIININSVIPHYNEIASFVNIAPNVAMGGGTKIGRSTFVGIGSSLKQYIAIGKNVIVGAGSVLISDIEDNSIVVGVPGKVIKKTKEYCEV